MENFDSYLLEQLADEEFRREFYRLQPFSRLADHLIELRLKKGLTQQELATLAGTTQAVVSRLENATVKPSMETIQRLAEALGAVMEVQLVPEEDYPGQVLGLSELPSMIAPKEEVSAGKLAGYYSMNPGSPTIIQYWSGPLSQPGKKSAVRKQKVIA